MRLILSTATIVLLAVSIAFSASTDAWNQGSSTQELNAAPLAFTENQGQWDERVLFRANANETVLWFCRDGVYHQHVRRLAADGSDPGDPAQVSHRGFSSEVSKASFVGANPDPQIVGEELMEYRCNYFIGNDPAKWRTGVPNYRAIRYDDVYPGIDVRFYGSDGSVQYDIIASSEADRSVIELSYEGADEIQTADGGQMWPGASSEEIAATAGARGLVFSTYLGGMYEDFAYDVSTDGVGNVYVAGYTPSDDFPILNAYDGILNMIDAYVTKFSPDGTLLYSTFLGGSWVDWGAGIVCYSGGNAVVVGHTESTDFPTVNPYDDSYNGENDVFIAELSPDGSMLLFGSYLGGADDDDVSDVDVYAGYIYVTGTTVSTDFPTFNPTQATIGSDTDSDAFATVIESGQSALAFSTYFGGSGPEIGGGIAAGPDGMLHMSGSTESDDMPTHNAFQPTWAGSRDAFVAKINPLTPDYIFSTYCGGGGNDYSHDIAVEQSTGRIFVVGIASPSGFPIVNAYDSTSSPLGDIFVTRLSADGSAVEYSTYLGGDGGDQAWGVSLCSDGSACVLAHTTSTDLPMVGAFDDTYNGAQDAFVAKIGPNGNTLEFSSYLGGSDKEEAAYYGGGIATDPDDNILVVGFTNSDDFPTVNAHDFDLSGTYDGFVVKIEPPASYVVGDADGSGGVDIDDAVYLIAFIFSGGPAPVPYESGDADCSGTVDIDDVVYLIAFIFSGGPEPGDPNGDGVPDC